MKTIIEKHKPLNTEKNIIALFEELKKEQYTYSTELGLKILREIGSVNLEYLQILKETIDEKKKKISLGFRKAEDNPWEIIKTKYQVGDTYRLL